jgi:hypothetical protein
LQFKVDGKLHHDHIDMNIYPLIAVLLKKIKLEYFTKMESYPKFSREATLGDIISQKMRMDKANL